MVNTVNDGIINLRMIISQEHLQLATSASPFSLLPSPMASAVAAVLYNADITGIFPAKNIFNEVISWKS